MILSDLKRMEIEEVGASPQRLAIHEQLGDRTGPVAVHAIAEALDIVEIREERLTNLDVALLMFCIQAAYKWMAAKVARSGCARNAS